MYNHNVAEKPQINLLTKKEHMGRKNRSSNWVWGLFLLGVAAFVVINQFKGFANLGIGSIIAAVLSVVFFVQCIANLSFAPLPIPLAVLYIVFQVPFELPYIKPWLLILASVLASAGLSILLPRKHKIRECGNYSHSGDHHPQMRTEDGDNDNNPVININFGAVSRRLHANSLETAQLHCRFGALEIFFDQAELSPNGAEATLDCSFGAIKLLVPKHWRITDKVNCSLGGIDVDNRYAAPAENAPQLTLTGNVSLGGIEVRYI